MRALALACVLLFLPTPAIACQCGQPKLADSVAHAEVAFLGTITKITSTKTSMTYEVAVEGVWKGTVPAIARVTTTEGDCALVRLDAKRYVIFTDKAFSLGMCGGGTRPATAAIIAEITKLRGAPKAP